MNALESPTVLARTKLVLWTGKKHSGKTTGAARLARAAREQGFDVAGLLAQAVHCNGSLAGFDAIDLRTAERAPLARRRSDAGKTCPFDFITEGVNLGRTALSLAAAESAELVVVDEFGPVEMNCRGWRTDVDLLVRSSKAAILLVVRDELAGQVQRLYASVPSVELPGGYAESVDKVISILKSRRAIK